MMKKSEFIAKLKEALEIDRNEKITEDTNLRDLEEFNSLGALVVIATVDEIFAKELSADDLRNVTTVRSLIKIIGEDKFD